MNGLKITTGGQEREFKDLELFLLFPLPGPAAWNPGFPLKEWGILSHDPGSKEMGGQAVPYTSFQCFFMKIKNEYKFLLPCFVYRKLPSTLFIP